MAKNPKEVKKKTPGDIEEAERQKLNQLLGSSVTAAFNLAVENGATVAGRHHPASLKMDKVGMVDRVPEIQLIQPRKKK